MANASVHEEVLQNPDAATQVSESLSVSEKAYYNQPKVSPVFHVHAVLELLQMIANFSNIYNAT